MCSTLGPVTDDRHGEKTSFDLNWDLAALAPSVCVEKADDKVVRTTSPDGGPALGSPSSANSFTLQFEVVRSRDSDGGGMVLGVADADSSFASGHIPGWGVNLYNGRPVCTDSVFTYGDEDYDKVWEISGADSKQINGSTVTLDVCRVEACITFSINDDPPFKVSVSGLSASLRPWVLFGKYDGDLVKLVSMTEHPQLVVTVECQWDPSDCSCTITCTSLSGEELATKRVSDLGRQTFKDCFPSISDTPIAYVNLVTPTGKKIDASDKDTVMATLFAEELKGRTCSASDDD